MVPALLFYNTAGNILKTSKFNERVLSRIGEAFEVRLSSHCFRDTAAMVGYDEMQSVRSVQTLLGHCAVGSTEEYLAKSPMPADALPVFEEVER